MHSQKQPKLRTVQIHTLDDKGWGEGTSHTGGNIHVPYVIPDELVEVDKIRGGKGALLDVIHPSSHRIHPRCSHFSHCGGCLWQHMEYPYQLHWKQKLVTRYFQRHGLSYDTEDFPVQSSSPFHYRNRMDFVWWYDGRFGLRERMRWHSVIDLNECYLLPPHVMQTALTVNRRVQEAHLPFKDQKHRVPGLRYLVIRCGIHTEEIMLSFVSDSLDLSPSLWQDLDQVTSVYQLVNNNLENDQSDGEPIHLDKNECYQETIADHTFSVGPRSFFQPNPAVAQAMVKHIQSLLADKPTQARLLDLYCGIGLFSIILSSQFDHITGVENNSEAIAWAKHNDKNSRIEWICSEVEELDGQSLGSYDVLLVDPPRAGIHPRALKTIFQCDFPEIIYVSCNPKRGAEDIAYLTNHYSIQSLQLFDQFPQTPHIELIAHLKHH